MVNGRRGRQGFQQTELWQENGEWCTLPSIAHRLGVPDSTARRWAAALADLLPARGRGPRRRYGPEAVEVLVAARDLYKQGLSTEQVREAMLGRYPRHLEVIAPAQPPESPSHQAVAAVPREALLPVLVAALDRQEQQLSALAQEVDNLRAELATTRDAVKDAAHLAERRWQDQRRWEREKERKQETRDREFVESLYETQNRHRPWWWPF